MRDGSTSRSKGPSSPPMGLSSTTGNNETSQGLSFVLAGHSRGGKISVLAAARDREAASAGERRRVSGLMLLDPVDGSYDSTVGPR